MFKYTISLCSCIICIALFSPAFAFDMPMDSIRLEIAKDGKKAWVIHKVEPKETLYSLSRRYNVSQDEIVAENPTAKSLKIDDVLRIPYKDFEKMAVYTSSQNNGQKNGVKKHTVESGENLFRISKKYGISVKELQEWNGLGNSTDVKAGQVLLVSSPQNQNVVKDNKENKTEKPAVNKVVHTVKEDEYLYTISKKYNVKITELLEWNNLKSDKLSIGQTLEVYPSGYKKDEKAEAKTETKTETKTAEVKTENKTDVKPETKQQKNTEIESSSSTVNVSGYNKVVEKGMAEVIEDDNTSNYVGLHKDAPVGTIVSIKNEGNGESVFVRIIGKLPSIGANEKTLIKVSKNVYEALGAKGTRFPVEVSYIP
jgi:LysM repeat protein